jgi:long-chain acyl-CoA synthetase
MDVVRTPVQAMQKWQQKYPDRVFLRQPINGAFHEKTWASVAREVGQIASGLKAQGMEPGDRVAIFSKNCAEWLIADLAIMMIGCVSVPIYATANRQTISYVLKHSGSKLVVVGKLDNYESLSDAIPKGITRVAMPYPTLKCDLRWTDWLAHQPVYEKCHGWDPQETMSLIYTSGSTGDPKGVEISFAAYYKAAKRLTKLLDVRVGDRALSYLPLAHITERVFIEGTALLSGKIELSFVESLDTFPNDLRSVQPTLFLSVPRLWTRFQMGIFEKLHPTKLNVLLKLPIVSTLVKSKLRKALGLNKARILGCGSAPVAPSLLRWYESIGLPISEAWGMTENLAFGTLNIPYRCDKVGTIGKPAEGVEVKISDEGEILVRSDVIMSGYYKQPDKTAETLIDGWLHTGDKGELDGDGYVRITGRVKDIFKTAKGKYVTPVPIEQKLMVNPMFEQVCVVGSARVQPVALAVLAQEMMTHSHAQIETSLTKTLNDVNKTLESHARLGHVIILKSPWNVENALLTPTLKVRRHELEDKFADLCHQEFDSPIVFEPTESVIPFRPRRAS